MVSSEVDGEERILGGVRVAFGLARRRRRRRKRRGFICE